MDEAAAKALGLTVPNVTPRYGLSPAMQAITQLKEFEALSIPERIAAIDRLVVVMQDEEAALTSSSRTLS